MTNFDRNKAITAFVAIICLAGCEAAKSSNPTAPSVAGPIPGVNITAPRPLEPYAGSTLTFSNEPPTLLIENAGTSGNRALFLQIEVGADATFQQLVHQADQIALGANGRTTYRLPAPLGAGYTYYWRIRAGDGADIGPYSAVSSFTVVPPVRSITPRCHGARRESSQPTSRISRSITARSPAPRASVTGLKCRNPPTSEVSSPS